MAEVVFSTLGWVYIGLAAVWTVLLICGATFLHRHRRLPFLQIRRLPLVFTAIALLHAYGTLCMLGLTIGPAVPCEAMFWVMSLYLPFGMALLQAANSQFQYIATRQRGFAQFNNLEDYRPSTKSMPIDPSLSWWRRTALRFQRMDKVTRVLVVIGIAMVVEILLTLFIYFGSEIFHPSYGLFNVKVPGTEQQRSAICFQGWEWWLSIAWQFFWAWFYAPYMLWKTRNIHDTHGWRIQTICCCIAGLPASPLWLAGLYAPAMAPVNAVVFPPQWFSLSVFFIEVFTIGIPCWHVIKTHNLKQETLDAIAAWERRNQGISENPDAISSKTSAGSSGTLSLAITGRTQRTQRTKGSNTSAASRDSTLTMAALENVLKNNPQPLLEFAALKDFSGENISFLSHVSEWKRTCVLSKKDPSLSHELFVSAVRIYSHFVSLEYSDFPVNISSRTAKSLHQIFSKAADQLNRRRNSQADSATPFDDVLAAGPVSRMTTNEDQHGGLELEVTLGKANLESVSHMPILGEEDGSSRVELTAPIEFGASVFDDAEKEIKYLVLTNTWPKFVHAGFESVSQTSRRKEKHEGLSKYLCV
ncbi:hypothetical protein BX600DRAFT_432942 [Xylariales sp. PMI_506]|nr:hypothetical protein BX600DRAFT_432942 [Xylariales sp. PMI_506]